MMKTTLTGDWDKLASKLRSLPNDVRQGKKQGVEKAGKLVVDTMKSHISSQDLGWTALSDSTIKQKGHDTIYVETGTLQSSIDSTVVSEDQLFIGAKQGAKNSNGESINDILKYHELGTEKEPPRPLVRPSYTEVKPKVKQIVKEEIVSAIRK